MIHSAALSELTERGFVYQGTNLEALDAAFIHDTVTVYSGIDITAPSLQVGNLIPLMMLRILARHGHKIIMLLGGATTLLGDPSGRNTQRPLLEEAVVLENTERFTKFFNRFFESHSYTLVNNRDWLGSLGYLSMLREVGPHFSINRMLRFDTVQTRIAGELPLSLLEFNYMVMQAYDFKKLYESHNCKLQIGGSDQWGNIVCGVDLVRRTCGGEVFGLTAPLVTTASGEKMGKSAQGAIWVMDDMLSPYDYWQFWRNTADADVVRWMHLFTELPVSSIKPWKDVTGKALNEAKHLLADHATALIHGKEVLPSIHETVKVLFSNLRSEGSKAVIPTVRYSCDALFQGISLVEALVALKLAPSRSRARGLIEGGGVTMGGQKIEDTALLLDREYLYESREILLCVGKKHYGRILMDVE